MRTEKDVLNDFEKLGWNIIRLGVEEYYNFTALCLNNKIPNYYFDEESLSKEIVINLDEHEYSCCDGFYGTDCPITMQEHKLLNELFTIWGWLE